MKQHELKLVFLLVRLPPAGRFVVSLNVLTFFNIAVLLLAESMHLLTVSLHLWSWGQQCSWSSQHTALG